MTAGLQVRGLVVDVDGRRSVDGLDLTVDPGSITFLTGPNGCGSGPFLAAVAGALPSRAGTIELDGVPLSNLPKGTATLVPAQRGLFPSLDLEDNLLVAARVWRLKGVRRAERLEAIWTAFPALAELRNRPVRTFSGGQQRLAAIARALLPDPRVLLLDEPSTGLSPLAWAAVADACRQEAARATVVLIGEQRLALAEGFAPRCVVLQRGRSVFDGRPGDATELDRDYFGAGTS